MNPAGGTSPKAGDDHEAAAEVNEAIDGGGVAPGLKSGWRWFGPRRPDSTAVRQRPTATSAAARAAVIGMVGHQMPLKQKGAAAARLSRSEQRSPDVECADELPAGQHLHSEMRGEGMQKTASGGGGGLLGAFLWRRRRKRD